jgi:hypothetical protein
MKFCPYGRPVLPEPLVWLLRSVPLDVVPEDPEDPLLEVVPEDPEDPLLVVVPDVVEPSEKGLWKGLLGTGLWRKGLQELKQLPPEVMVLLGEAQGSGLLWMNSTEGLLRTLWAGLLVGAG